MSIEVSITEKELREIKRVLRKKSDCICLCEDAYLKVLLVAHEMLMTGKDVNAKIVKGYK